MRLLLTVALSLVVLPLFAESADFDLTRNATDQPSPIVVAKAQASGITFVSNAEHYQLISGGRAVKSGADTSGMVAGMVQSQNQSQPLWKGSKGPFALSIANQHISQGNMRALASIRSGNDKQIAYNPRTKGIGIITGNIIVSYTASFDAELIGSQFNIQLADDFPHLKTAFYSVNPEQDIFQITETIKQSGLVSSAEIEVIEHFLVPH